MKYTVRENKILKIVESELYNSVLNKQTGFFARWGRTKEEDPLFAPAPEIADIEISSGKCSGNCPWCYKSNSAQSESKYMSFETFQKIFEKISKSKILGQIAFGITDLDSNPDLYKIMWHCRDNGVIPNITINGNDLTDIHTEQLSKVCGAIAVSHYNSDICFDAVNKLCKAKDNPGATLVSVNIHQLLAKETYGKCLELLDSYKTDERLKDLGAIVFLSLKPKGNKNKLHSISSIDDFVLLFSKALEMNVPIGMDSCTAPLTFKAIEKIREKCPEKVKGMEQSIEPCESCLVSSYINVDSKFFPCSFSEGTEGWEEGINILDIDDFVKDVWFSDKVNGWRNRLLKSSSNCSCSFKNECRSCPIYDITLCK